MKILIDITHPAQVHFFKNLIWRFRKNKDKVIVTARQKDVTVELLKKSNIPYISLSHEKGTFLGTVWELLERDVSLLKIAKRFRPDVMLAQTGVSIGIVGALLRIPRIVLEEAEHARLQRLIGLPFANIIMTGTGYLKNHGSRQRTFRGIWVQAYLDSRYFRADPEPLRKVGINIDRPYILLRTVSWSAAHDVGLKGLLENELMSIVEKLSRFGQVFISSEGPLPDSLNKYKSPVRAEYIHHLLAFASLYIGEGGTMAAEASVMGIPSIFCNPLRCGYLLALEKDYGLVCNCNNIPEGLDIAEELFKDPDLKSIWQKKKEKLLDESEDITEFMFGLVNKTALE